MEIRTLYKDYRLRLQTLYPVQEAESLVLWLFEHFLGIKRMDILQGKQVSIPPALEEALLQLTNGRPIQYITQSAPFYGRNFKVNPSVLIPRHETEELVHLILYENQMPCLKILDVGTGSGCIPITLALEMEGADISTVDISEGALALAKSNAETLSAASSIEFYRCDVLHEDFPVWDLDIVVSNPPYVREMEKSSMHSNVLDHEPHLALFVPDDKALIFYEQIADKALTALKPGGKLYFEINEALGDEVVRLLSLRGYHQIKIKKDLNDKDRMVSAIK